MLKYVIDVCMCVCVCVGGEALFNEKITCKSVKTIPCKQHFSALLETAALGQYSYRSSQLTN